MKTTSDWHNVIAAEAHLPPDTARQLCDIGFVVVPGPLIPGGRKPCTWTSSIEPMGGRWLDSS
jgi:hypothetical protein